MSIFLVASRRFASSVNAHLMLILCSFYVKKVKKKKNTYTADDMVVKREGLNSRMAVRYSTPQFLLRSTVRFFL